jgi:8-oxo-dGTP pyrophosphatase MutT (NUDIX family)
MGKYRYNRYHDVEIDVARLDVSSEGSLIASVVDEEARWEHRVGGRRGCEAAVMWLRVPINLCRVISCLISPGSFGGRPFRVHHANGDHFMLVRPWRNSRGHSKIPLYGTHYIRVECVVMEDGSGRVLMVKERIGPQGGGAKLVTGAIDPGEFVSAAATREVFEETGVRATYVGVIGCGNRLHTRFDRDEILLGVIMRAQPGQTPSADGEEISSASWYSPDDAYNFGSSMAREWLVAAAAAPSVGHGQMPDPFRGHPHTMEFTAARQKDAPPQQSK